MKTNNWTSTPATRDDDVVVTFDSRAIIRRGIVGAVFIAATFSAPAIVWIIVRSRPLMPFPTESVFIFVLAVVAFAACVFVERNVANTQRCVVTATELKYSVTRWTANSTTTVPLDAIEAVNVRSDCCFGIAYVSIETAATLERDSDGDKRASAAILVGVLDAENVQRAILARRNALRQHRAAVAVAVPVPYVVIEMPPSSTQHE